jgi:hypothetical protein
MISPQELSRREIAAILDEAIQIIDRDEMLHLPSARLNQLPQTIYPPTVGPMPPTTSNRHDLSLLALLSFNFPMSRLPPGEHPSPNDVPQAKDQ